MRDADAERTLRLLDLLRRALVVWNAYRIDDTEEIRALEREIREEVER